MSSAVSYIDLHLNDLKYIKDAKSADISKFFKTNKAWQLVTL